MKTLSVLVFILFLITSCISQVLLPKVIDGSSADWSTLTENFVGTDNVNWFFSWDDASFYYAISAQVVQAQPPNTFAFLYVDSDPNVALTTGNGTTQGLQFNTQKPVLGFNADVFISWKLDDTFAEIRQFTGGSFVQVSTSLTRVRNGSFVEFQVPRSFFNNSPNLVLAGCLLDETALAEVSFGFIPNNNRVRGFFATVPLADTFFGFSLNTNASPNSLANLKFFPASSIVAGPFNDPATWAAGQIPEVTSTANILTNVDLQDDRTIANLNVYGATGTLTHTAGKLTLAGGATLTARGSSSPYVGVGGSVETLGNFLVLEKSAFTFRDFRITNGAAFVDDNFGITGTFTIAGGFVDETVGIQYATNSVLVYATGTSYARFNEWKSGDLNAVAGRPFSVLIQDTDLSLGQNSFSKNETLNIPGNLQINAAGTLSFPKSDNFAVDFNGPMIVHGNLILSGTVALSLAADSDLIVQGSITLGPTHSVICNSGNTILNAQNVPFSAATISQADTKDGSGKVLFTTLTATPVSNIAYSSIQWNINGDIINATSVNVTANNTAVTVTTVDQHGCSATVQKTISFFDVVVPNPAVAPPVDPPIALIIGVSVAGLFLLLLLILLVALLVRRRNKKRKETSNDLAMVNDDSSASTNYLTLPTKREVEHSLAEYEEKSIDLGDVIYEEKIGAGAFGVVYKGSWKKKTVAIKKLKDSEFSSSELTTFKQEIDLMKKLPSHMNVIYMYGAHTKTEPYVIVTEFCEFGSLQDYFKKGKPLSRENQTIVINGTAAGLAHLHQSGIIHRDLAARNILLTQNFTPKISDFGLSRSVATTNASGETKSNTGPLKWMAPECINDKTFSAKSDVWSFGVLMVEVFIETEPYPDIDALKVAVEVSQGRLKPDIPDSANIIEKSVMKKCFLFKPENRPSMGSILSKLQKTEDSDSSDSSSSSSSSQPQTTYGVLPSTKMEA